MCGDCRMGVLVDRAPDLELPDSIKRLKVKPKTRKRDFLDVIKNVGYLARVDKVCRRGSAGYRV